MRVAVVLAAIFAVATASQRPAYLQTAGNPYALNITHDEVTESAVGATPNGWTMYKQCDSAWANNQLGTCSLTICQAGCAMSSVAMILNTRGVGVNPASLNSWLDGNGGYESGCDIVWASVDKFGKTSFQGIEQASEASICAGVAAGHGIVANVRSGTHWVLITGCQGGGVFDVNDPGFNQATYTLGDISQEAVYH